MRAHRATGTTAWASGSLSPSPAIPDGQRIFLLPPDEKGERKRGKDFRASNVTDWNLPLTENPENPFKVMTKKITSALVFLRKTAEMGTEPPLLFYLPKRLKFTKWVNSDFLTVFTVMKIANKHGWPESLVWSQALVNANDFDRFKLLQ
jgi:hypothetical protein